MSQLGTNFEQMLREALVKARDNASRANDELLQIASEASDAVSRVTDGAARLELSPLCTDGDDTDEPLTYQLQLRKNDDSDAPWSDLGVFQVTETGYPVNRWPTRSNWESNPDQPERQHTNIQDLKGNFDDMLSRPDSRLVILVHYLQQLKAVK